MTIYGVPWWIAVIFWFLLGANIGSFLNVCVYRLPLAPQTSRPCGFWDVLKWRIKVWYLDPYRHVTHPPSSCPRCGHRLQMFDNLPVVGWLKLGGRCRHCRSKISPRYPIVEFLNGLLVVGLYFLEVPIPRLSDAGDSLLSTPLGPFASDSLLNDFWLVHARFFYHLVLIELLIVASLIDWDLTEIPPSVTDPWILFGLVGSALGGMWLWPLDFDLPMGLANEELMAEVMDAPDISLIPLWMTAHPVLHGLAVSMTGAIVGYVSVWSIRLIASKIIGIEAVGAGDVWLMAMVGSFLGWQPVIIAEVLSLFFAFAIILVRLPFGLSLMMPYGPSLSLGTAATLLGWSYVWPRAAQFFDLGPVFLGALAVTMLVLMAVMLILIQSIKRLLGIAPYEEFFEDAVWRASDQHQYQAGERPMLDVNQWPSRNNGWSGTHSARGQNFERQWRGR